MDFRVGLFIVSIDHISIIWLYHDMPIAEHGGQWKMVKLVTRNYWWPEVTKEVK